MAFVFSDGFDKPKHRKGANPARFQLKPTRKQLKALLDATTHRAVVLRTDPDLIKDPTPTHRTPRYGIDE